MQLEVKKISNQEINLNVHGQGCKDDCEEHNIWVGKTDGNVSGCVIYETAYTPKGTWLW